MDPYDSPLRSPIVLGGSGVVISRVLSPLIWVISIVTDNPTPASTRQHRCRSEVVSSGHSDDIPDPNPGPLFQVQGFGV